MTYAQVYERRLPGGNVDGLNAQGRNGEIDIIVVTSADALKNLFVLAGESGMPWLRRAKFLSISQRIVKVAVQLGVQTPVLVSAGSSDAAIVKTLARWRESHEDERESP